MERIIERELERYLFDEEEEPEVLWIRLLGPPATALPVIIPPAKTTTETPQRLPAVGTMH